MIMSDKNLYGGQAVIEGVMFGGKHVTVTAVRRKDQSIDYFHVYKKTKPWVKKLKKIPLLRGIVALIEASANGSKHLDYSSQCYDVDPGEEEVEATGSGAGKLAMILGVAVVGVLSFLFGKLLFTVLPTFLEDLIFSRWEMQLFFIPGYIVHNIIEGGIKILLLLGYILAIAQTPLIKRLFQYHGAEHKVINAYEAGVELTVENVQKFSTLHYRCGSSFIIFTVLIGVVIYSFFPYDTLWERIAQRVVLIPVVIGVSFEVLQLTNKVRNLPLLRYLGYPGLWLQKITTREPDDSQVETAIHSFNKMRELDKEIPLRDKFASTG